MSAIAFELSIIFVLLLANGVFAMAEISIVSARKSRLRHRAEQGDVRSGIALELAESPNRFLATVQIGITLVGVLAAAFSGANLADKLAAPLRDIEWIAPYADKVAFGIVVVGLTYFSLVVGELVPKRIGLANPEGIASLLAGPMGKLSNIGSPVVSLLGWSTDILLKVFQVKSEPKGAVTEEEVRLLVKEGTRAGIFHPHEPAMIERVMQLDRLPVSDLMTLRAKIIWLHIDDRHEIIWHKVVVSGHTTFPVYQGSRDNVVGVVTVKAMYANFAARVPIKLKDLMTPALIVAASQSASNLLEEFKQTGKHVALVVDEFGGIMGLVSLHDIMEAILGEMPSLTERSRPRAVCREDGAWLVDGMLDAGEIERLVPGFKLHSPTERNYQTFAGFVMQHLGHVPKEGESFPAYGYQVEVIDMDGHRVDKVLLLPIGKKKETMGI